MFKKVILIIFLLTILLENHTLAPSKNNSLINAGSFLQSFHPIKIAYAAEKGQHVSNDRNKDETPSWSSYIVPGTVGIVLIVGIGSYWLVLRKKQIQKEA